jgi:hypothetical protein
MIDERDGVPLAEEYQPPEWLEQVLVKGETSLEFRRRCEDAALVALSIVKLRRERERLGFVPLPFAEYLTGLAKLASVALDPVLAFYDLAALPQWEQLASWARIARDLGFPGNQAGALLKIWRVEESDMAPFPMMVAARKRACAAAEPLAECEQTLEAIGHSALPDLLREFRMVDDAVRHAYEQQR